MVNLDLGLDLQNSARFANSVPGMLLGAIAAGAVIVTSLSQGQALEGQLTANGTLAGVATQTNVMVATISAAAGLTGDIAGSASTDAMFSGLAVQAGGWEMDGTVVGAVVGGTYNGLNDNAAPGMVLEVSSKSWTSLGVETTTTRNIYALAVQRQAFANNASLVETTVGSDFTTRWALSQMVFDTDTIVDVTFLAGLFTDDGAGGALDANLGGANPVTNSSTVTYELPQFVCLNPNLDWVETGTYAVKWAVAHAQARSGTPIAAVRIVATDGVTTIGAYVTTQTAEQWPGSGLYSCHYEADLDFTSLNAGLVTLHLEVYPWVGNKFDTAVDGYAIGTPFLAPAQVYNGNGGGYTKCFTYVSTSGNDGTGVVSTVAATAQATPYLTHAAAATGIRVFQNANDGHNDASGGIIRFETGTYAFATFSSVAVGDLPLIVEAANVANKATTIWQSTGNVFNGCPAKLLVRDLTINRTGNFYMLDTLSNLTSSQYHLVLDNIEISGSAGSLGVAQWDYAQYFNVTGAGALNITASASAATKQIHHLMVGCDGMANTASTRGLAYHAVACRNPGDFTGYSVINGLGQGNNVPLPEGALFQNNIWSDNGVSATALAISDSNMAAAGGFALVGNIIEKYNATGTPAALTLIISGGGNANNVTEANNTVVGGRSLIFYNDTGSGTRVSCYSKQSVHYEYNLKSDVHSSNGAYIGNWAVRSGVGGQRHFIDIGDNNGATAPAANGGAWIGEGLGDTKTAMPAGTVVTGNPDFVDDQSRYGGQAGGGNYAPGGLTDIPQIPAGETIASFDLHGTAIPTNGTARAGAVQ